MMSRATASPVRSTSAARSLAERVMQRVDQGLAPPPEAYHVHNRSKIDWTKVPEWARPSDPELFEGCVHEG
jgi:hypothetical protein